MGLFGNKFNKLKREDVINSICELEGQLGSLENGIVAKEKQIQDLMQKGRAEKSQEIRLFHAKRITQLKDEKAADAKRGMYLLYNIKLLNRLKEAIDDKNFVAVTAKASLGDLLKDQKSLAKFLNGALCTKTRQEDILTGADEVFNEVASGYDQNQEMYGMSKADEGLLAMFESMDDSIFGEQVVDEKEEKAKLEG